MHRKNPPEAPLHPWEWPSRPWERLHIEVHPTNVATSRATIEKPRATFAIHGIPTTLVSDNGSNFCSEEFEDFMRKNGIHHRITLHRTERAVQTFKDGMKKMSEEGSLETRISRFLFKYRITPLSTTGLTPAEMLMGRKRSRLDLLHPDIRNRVQNEQMRQKEIHDQHGVDRRLQPGNTVYAREFGKQEKWCPGVITTKTGPVSYTVQLNDDREVRRHQDQVIQRSPPPVSRTEASPTNSRSTNVPLEPVAQPASTTEGRFEFGEESGLANPNLQSRLASDQQVDPGEKRSSSARYSQRERRAPNFYY